MKQEEECVRSQEPREKHVSREDSKEGWSESEIADKSSGMFGHWQDIGNLDRVVGTTAG